MFKSLLKSDLLESGLSRLHDLQKKVESSFDEVLLPAQGANMPDPANSAPQPIVKDTQNSEIDTLRQQVESLSVELREKSKQLTELKATNLSLLEEGQKLSKRLGSFEEKARERQKELDAAQKTIQSMSQSGGETSRILQLEQLELDLQRLEREKADYVTNQTALTAENNRLQTLYCDTLTLLSSKKSTPTPSLSTVPDNSHLHAQIAQQGLEISRLNESIATLEKSAIEATASRTALEDNVAALTQKLELSEDLRKLTASTLAAPEIQPSSTPTPKRWVFSEQRTDQFEKALQAIGKLQDELEEAREVQALLRQQLRQQVINDTS